MMFFISGIFIGIGIVGIFYADKILEKEIKKFVLDKIEK